MKDAYDHDQETELEERPKTMQKPIPQFNRWIEGIEIAQAARLARSGRLGEAEQELLATGELSAPGLDLLARIYAQQGYLSKAEQAWQQALTCEPGNVVYRAGMERIARMQRQRLWLPAFVPLALILLIVVLLLGAGWRLLPPINQLTFRLDELSTPLAGMAKSLEKTAILATPSIPDLVPAIQSRLQNDADLAGAGVSIRQSGSVIYLVGTVAKSEWKDNAEALVRQVDGVGAVDASELKVVPPDLAPIVNRALAEHKLFAGQVHAIQIRDAILLTGTVPDESAKQQAEQIAYRIAGVSLVDSSGLRLEQLDLANAVGSAIQHDARTYCLSVNVRQFGKSVALTATVPDETTKKLLEDLAHGVGGVELVDTNGVTISPVSVEYIVQQNDSLPKIAKFFYNDEAKWPLIYTANQDNIVLPITAGFRLRIPVIDQLACSP